MNRAEKCSTTPRSIPFLKPDAQRVEQIPHKSIGNPSGMRKEGGARYKIDPRANQKAFSMDSSAETIVFLDEKWNCWIIFMSGWTAGPV